MNIPPCQNRKHRSSEALRAGTGPYPSWLVSGHSLCGKTGKTWSDSRRHEGGTAVTHLPGYPIIQGYSDQRQKERLSRSRGGLGVNGSPVTSSESPDGSCPCPDREQRGDREGPHLLISHPVPWDTLVHAGQLCPYTESWTPGPSLAQGYLSQLPSSASR